MSVRDSYKETKVVSHAGEFITPGETTFKVINYFEVETWYMGELISTELREDPFEITQYVYTPGVDPETGQPCRETYNLYGRTWTVVREDDPYFWGSHDGKPMTKSEWLLEVNLDNSEKLQLGAQAGWWDIDAQGNPVRPAMKVSIAELQNQGKVLMAHLMVDLGFFPSVSQARKNGWDKPLELGRHELGPKKKRAFVEIVP